VVELAKINKSMVMEVLFPMCSAGEMVLSRVISRCLFYLLFLNVFDVHAILVVQALGIKMPK
jgi:hypothetical protein